MLITLGLIIGLLSPILYLLDTHFIRAQFIFDPVKLQQISQSAISMHGSGSNATEPLLRQITQDLRAAYGDAVQDWTADDWFFNNAGGAMGTMVILHASVSEYLIFFGTALQTEGHSGVHLADDYFTILTGHQHAAKAGELTAHVFGPGDQNHLRRGEAVQYSMPGPCFALELAQGWIPAMLPFGEGSSQRYREIVEGKDADSFRICRHVQQYARLVQSLENGQDDCVGNGQASYAWQILI
jgi:C-8 sterol isomerase